ncbi:MAG: hypothetical protein JWN99_1136, partial [Ilumatobacteraceae bacterium]|nr:hypothetical protein [Ilumatobacteraceae bacterium]
MADAAVRHALKADLPALADAMATAFSDDPMMLWIAGDRDADARHKELVPGFFLPILEAGIGRGHTYTTTASGARPSGHRPMSTSSAMHRAPRSVLRSMSTAAPTQSCDSSRWA